MTNYVIVIHPAEEGGYWAEVPVLPGCYTQAETIDDLIANAGEAIESHIEALHAGGQRVPDEAIIIATVRVPEAA